MLKGWDDKRVKKNDGKYEESGMNHSGDMTSSSDETSDVFRYNAEMEECCSENRK